MPRSPPGSWCPSARWTTTSPLSSKSWACARGGRRPPRRTSWGSDPLSRGDSRGLTRLELDRLRGERGGVEGVVARPRVDRQRVEGSLGVADIDLGGQAGEGGGARHDHAADEREVVVAG